MSFYKRNLAYLEKNNPLLHKLVTVSLPFHEAATELFPADNNALVKTGSGQCFIHSLYDRTRELQRTFAATDPEAQAIVLFGLGMGDAIQYAADNFPALEHLMVIEPNMEIFKAFLERADLAAIFRGQPKVTFILNQPIVSTASIINEAMNQDLYYSLELAYSLSYRTLYPAYYRDVSKACLEAVRSTMVNLATRKHSADKWLANEWRNQKYAGIDLETIMKRVPPLPAIIVAAGPSLNKNIHLLVEAKNKAVIFAVGSAMTILETHGITPHFRVAIDGNETTKKVFAAVDTTKCPLIYCNALYHEVLPHYCGGKIQMVMNTDRVTQYLRKKKNKPSRLIRSGYSVANIAADIACQWGCPQVILVGQDLCYTGGNVHATGAWDDDAPSRLLTHSEMIKVHDIHGQEVLTDQALMGIKAWFEELALYYPQIKFINATEGGLPINGFADKTLCQVLADDLREPKNVSQLIDRAMNDDNDENPITELLETAAGELAEIIDTNEALMEQLRDIQARLDRGEDADGIIAELTTVGEQIANFRANDYYTSIVFYFLADTFQTLRRRYAYTGSDKKRKSEALIKTYASQLAELQRFTTYNYNLLVQCDDRMPYSVWREFM